MSMRHHHLRHGFSLIELLVIIAIVGVLVALIGASVGAMRSSARGTRCVSNLRQIGMLFSLYRQDNDNRLPVDIQIDQQTNASKTWDNYLKDYLTDSREASRPADVFGCPSVVPNPATPAMQSSYGINYHLGSHMSPRVRIPFNNIVNPSRTFLVTDADERSFRRESLAALETGNGRYEIAPVERHNRRLNMLFADGSVKVIPFDDMPWGSTYSTTLAPWGYGP